MTTLTLVETLPADLDLAPIAGTLPTAETLIRHTQQARQRIDLITMYWALLAESSAEDVDRFGTETLDEMGAHLGRELYQALWQAAERGVVVRLLESPGFDPSVDESRRLQAAFPDQVTIRQLDMSAWYDGGIVHQKLWLWDDRAAYIGSANPDWKALAQVKELGILVEEDAAVLADAARYFETWWRFATLPPQSATIFDAASQVTRRVPNWSPQISAEIRQPNPLDQPDLTTAAGWATPHAVEMNGQTGELLLTNSPSALSVGARSDDLDVIVATILSAERHVDLAVMDFAPTSYYYDRPDPETGLTMGDGEQAHAIYWPPLTNAILQAVVTHGVVVRLLVSEWAHSAEVVAPYLRALQANADAASQHPNVACGQLQIRRMCLPGGNEIVGESRPWPHHTRVNHAKFIVTDQRVNIGTSNFTWDYFHGTGGLSLNTSHPDIVAHAQAIFDRDWHSDYCHAP